MEQRVTKSPSCIALVAHDNKKAELVEWVKQHRDIPSNYALCVKGPLCELPWFGTSRLLAITLLIS
jgi:methylglyoxal synthase